MKSFLQRHQDKILGVLSGFDRIRFAVTEQFAQDAGRPVQYLDRQLDKEELVQKLRDQQAPTENGLVAVLSALETCQSFNIFRNRQTQHIELRRRLGKCLHYYFTSTSRTVASV